MSIIVCYPPFLDISDIEEGLSALGIPVGTGETMFEFVPFAKDGESSPDVVIKFSSPRAAVTYLNANGKEIPEDLNDTVETMQAVCGTTKTCVLDENSHLECELPPAEWAAMRREVKATHDRAPKVVLLAPAGATLPEGFPYSSIEKTGWDLLSMMGDASRGTTVYLVDDKHAGVITNVLSLDTSMEFKRLVSLPDVDYSPTWMVATDSLPSVSVTEIMALRTHDTEDTSNVDLPRGTATLEIEDFDVDANAFEDDLASLGGAE